MNDFDFEVLKNAMVLLHFTDNFVNHAAMENYDFIESLFIDKYGTEAIEKSCQSILDMFN